MKLRLAAALIAAFALSACSDADWSQTMNSVGLGDAGEAEPAAETAPAPAAAPAQIAPGQTAQAEPNNAFCLAVARQDSERNAFDAETQQGVFTRSYRQCLTIFGAGTPQ